MTSPQQTTTDVSHFSGAWTLDPAQTSIAFQTKAMWFLTVKGTFDAAEGAGTVGADGSLTGTLVVNTASINTNNKKRDTHLRSADFFEVDKYPQMTFEATGARPTGAGKVEVTGTLTIHGESRPLTVEADVQATADTAKVEGAFEIDRSAWGLTWAKMGAGLGNHVTVSAHFVRA